MTDAAWSPEQLRALDGARELEIAVRRADGTLRPAVPIWVVTAHGGVAVRTWYRRDTGWFGAATTARRARVRVPGLVLEVAISEIGDAARAEIDAAYRAKYGVGGSTERMVSDEAVGTTLRLEPVG